MTAEHTAALTSGGGSLIFHIPEPGTFPVPSSPNAKTRPRLLSRRLRCALPGLSNADTSSSPPSARSSAKLILGSKPWNFGSRPTAAPAVGETCWFNQRQVGWRVASCQPALIPFRRRTRVRGKVPPLQAGCGPVGKAKLRQSDRYALEVSYRDVWCQLRAADALPRQLSLAVSPVQIESYENWPAHSIPAASTVRCLCQTMPLNDMSRQNPVIEGTVSNRTPKPPQSLKPKHSPGTATFG